MSLYPNRRNGPDYDLNRALKVTLVDEEGEPNYGGAGGGGAGTGGGFGTSQGDIQALPADNVNGTELPNRPTNTRGVIFFIPTGGDVTWFRAEAGLTPDAPPTNTVTFDPASAEQFPAYASNPDSIYVTVHTGDVLFMWVA